MRKSGEVGLAAVVCAKAVGVTDGEVIGISGHVALNIFTNYVNIVAQTEIDFQSFARRNCRRFKAGPF